MSQLSDPLFLNASVRFGARWESLAGPFHLGYDLRINVAPVTAVRQQETNRSAVMGEVMQQPLEYESRERKQPCPFCQSMATVPGDLLTADTDAVKFVPHDLRLFARSFQRAGVLLQQTPVACRDCGAVWSTLDAPKLREVLERWGRGDSGSPIQP